jgi:hypothetical protein
MLPAVSLSLAALAAIAQAGPVPRDAAVQDAVSITQADLSVLSRFSRYSAAAYCNADTAAGKPIVCETPACAVVNADKGVIVQTFHTPQTDIAGYVAVVDSRKEIIFAVRGTVSNANWAVNLDFGALGSILAPGAWMHQGFFNAWAEIADPVRRAIDRTRLAHPDYKIVITGHSLGGAVATMAAAYLRGLNGYPIDLYTYGQPRVGNSVFTDLISAQPGRLFRVTHEADPVPKVPLVFMDYRHTSPEIWLTGNATDPAVWPLAQAKPCYGNLNLACNGNLSLPLVFGDHSNYFGSMNCAKGAQDEVYIPQGVKEELKGEAQADKAIIGGSGLP